MNRETEQPCAPAGNDAAKRKLSNPIKSYQINRNGNEAEAREALKEIRARLVYLYGSMDGTFDPPALKEVCGIADEALAKPPRNCDRFRDVDKAYDQFMNYVKRENPSFTKASPLHTAWDALKWVLDGEKKGANA